MRLAKMVVGEEKTAASGLKRALIATIAAYPLLASCSIAMRAAPVRNESATARQVMATARKCGRADEVILEPGERVIETVCGSDMDFVLTSQSLVKMPRVGAEDSVGDVSATYKYAKTDVSEILGRGLVDWEVGASSCFFLAKDGSLTIVPNERAGETLAQVYKMPFDVRGITMDRRNDRMAFFSGYLFIAPVSGRAVVFSFSDGIDARYVDLPDRPDSGFVITEKKLFFGKKEIKIGKDIDSISCLP